MGSQIPYDVFWKSIYAARKAAYDAKFYDLSNAVQANEMIEITKKLIHTNGHRPPDGIDSIRQEIDEIRAKFYLTEKQLRKRVTN